MREAVCPPPEERRRGRRGDRRGGLEANDALRVIEDGKATSTINDLPDTGFAGAAANSASECVTRLSGGARYCCPESA